MTTILDLARDEIAALERRLATLRTIEAAALELDDHAVDQPPVDPPRTQPYRVPEQIIEPEPATEPAPAQQPATKPRQPRPARTTVRDVDAKILGTLLKANRRMSAAQIAEAAGVEKEALRKPLQRLVAAGQVVATGATKSRVYAAGAAPEPSAARKAHTNGVKKAATSEMNGVMRVKVLDLIRRDPAALTEDRIAAGLLADREDVALACGKLLETDKVILNSDGTYTATKPKAGVRT
jgi:DNA-binding Lrp family transcriptional regulator